MATGRFRVIAGSHHWTATVAGDRVTLADVPAPYTVHLDADGQGRVLGPDGEFAGIAARSGDRVWVAIDGETIDLTVVEGARRATGTALDDDAMAAPMAATVVRVNVAPGAPVSDGDVLIALEAMKMELPVRAPRDGIVKAVHCREGELVQPGAVLVELVK
jgi:3-methylcrotonyl-CoA carboxylase alpha subunit